MADHLKRAEPHLVLSLDKCGEDVIILPLRSPRFFDVQRDVLQYHFENLEIIHLVDPGLVVNEAIINQPGLDVIMDPLVVVGDAYEHRGVLPHREVLRAVYGHAPWSADVEKFMNDSLSLGTAIMYARAINEETMAMTRMMVRPRTALLSER